jgi:hypothetical protein
VRQKIRAEGQVHEGQRHKTAATRRNLDTFLQCRLWVAHYGSWWAALMRLLGRKGFWRRSARRVGVVVALVAYLAAAVGFPVPAASDKGDGVPFPCMNHPCGCRSAEQCWRGCCCLTVEERWDWAREHNVEPPSYAERPPASKKPVPTESPSPKGWQTARLRDQAAGHTSAAHSCSDCVQQAEAKRRVAAKPLPCCSAKETPSQPGSLDGLHWVGGSAALGCRGISTLWIASGAVTPPPAVLSWLPFAPPAEWLSPASDNPLGLSLIPPDPPPRCTHS